SSPAQAGRAWSSESRRSRRPVVSDTPQDSRQCGPELSTYRRNFTLVSSPSEEAECSTPSLQRRSPERSTPTAWRKWKPPVGPPRWLGGGAAAPPSPPNRATPTALPPSWLDP